MNQLAKTRQYNLDDLKQQLYKQQYIQALYYNIMNVPGQQERILLFFDKILEYLAEIGIVPYSQTQISPDQLEYYITTSNQPRKIIIEKSHQNAPRYYKDRSINIIGMMMSKLNKSDFYQFRHNKHQVPYTQIWNDNHGFLDNIYINETLRYYKTGFDKLNLFFEEQDNRLNLIRYITNCIYDNKTRSRVIPQRRNRRFVIEKSKEYPILSEIKTFLQKYLNIPLVSTSNQTIQIQLIRRLQLDSLFLIYLQSNILLNRELLFVGGIQNHQFVDDIESDERYIMRVLKYIYTRTYGFDPRINDIKRRSDFFLMIQPERSVVLQKQLDSFFQNKLQGDECSHHALLKQLNTIHLDNARKKQLTIELLSQYMVRMEPLQESSISRLVVSQSSNKQNEALDRAYIVDQFDQQIQIPIDSVSCNECGDVLICAHQALSNILYDDYDSFREIIKLFQVANSQVSNTNFYCKFCGQILQDATLLAESIPELNPNRSYKTIKNIFRSVFNGILTTQVMNTVQIFQDLVQSVYSTIKEQLVDFKTDPDYQSKKQQIILVFVCAYFTTCQGHNIYFSLKQAYQTHKFVSLKFDEFKDLVLKTQQKYKIRSLLRGSDIAPIEIIKQLLVRKVGIGHYFTELLVDETFDRIQQKQGDVIRLNLLPLYGIDDMKSLYKKSLYDIDSQQLERLLIAHAVDPSRQQCLPISQYQTLNLQIGITQTLTKNINNSRFISITTHLTDVYVPFNPYKDHQRISESQLIQQQNSFFIDTFYSNYCPVRIQKKIDDNKQQMQLIHTIAKDSGQCSLCGYNQTQESAHKLTEKFQKHVLVHFFTAFSPQIPKHYLIEKRVDIKLDFDQNFISKIAIQNNLKPMQLINLGGFDYIDYDKYIQEKLESIVSHQQYIQKQQYGSFMRLRIPSSDSKYLPKDLQFISKLSFDWSLYKPRFNKVANLLTSILLNLGNSQFNLDLRLQFNSVLTQFRSFTIKNYFVLTQCLIYHFFHHTYQQLKTHNSEKVLDTELHKLIIYDRQLQSQVFEGAIYQKQRKQYVKDKSDDLDQYNEDNYVEDEYEKQEYNNQEFDYDPDLIQKDEYADIDPDLID